MAGAIWVGETHTLFSGESLTIMQVVSKGMPAHEMLSYIDTVVIVLLLIYAHRIAG